MRVVKRVLLLSLLLVVVGIALFPKEILLKCVTWQTARYCSQAFGAQITYEAVVWEGGKIVFKKGELVRSGEMEATFERASLRPFFDVGHRTFGGKLTFEALKIIHRKKEIRPVLNPPSPSFKFFTLHLDTAIEGGELLFYDYLSKHRLFQHAFFDLNHHVLGEETSGTISITLDPHTPKLVTHFRKQHARGLQLEGHFESHSFSDFSHLVTYFFQNYLPEPAFQWDILEGTVGGNLEMTFIEGTPLTMKGDLVLKEVRGENQPLGVLVEVDHLICNLDIDFSKVSAMHGEFDLKGGRIARQEKETFWDLKNLHSTMSIKEGKVDSSTLQGTIMGMEGEIVLDWQAKDILVEMVFHGFSKDMQSCLPEKIQKPFAIAFPDDFFVLNASLKRAHAGLEWGGSLAITDKETHTHRLSFGCSCGSHDPTPMDLLVPGHLNLSLSHSVDAFLEHLKQQFCLSHKRFGWFQGERFPLEKFLSPFLLSGVQMNLSGVADFKATFDDRYLVIFYEGKEFDLQSPHFALHVDVVKEHLVSEIIAVHYFDLQTWDHVGFLPLKGAHYWQKNYGFHLENADAVVNFENNVIHIQNLKTCGEGIDFEGDLSLCIRSLTDVDLQIHVDRIDGSATDAQKFLAHFKPSFFWQIPCEGVVHGKEKSLFFHYHFAPTATLLAGRVHGEVQLNFSNPLFALREYKACVAYDCLKNDLRITEGGGSLIFPKRKSPLSLSTPSIHVSAIPDFLIDFSCTIKENADTFLTLLGTSQRSESGKEISLMGEAKGPIQIKALHNGKELKISEFSCGPWKGESSVTFEERSILIDHFSCTSQRAGFSFSGEYDYAGKHLSGEVDELKWAGCVYSSKAGLFMEELGVEIPIEEESTHQKLGKFHYDLQKNKIIFAGYDFCLPCEKLPLAVKIVSELFPGKFDPSQTEWITKLKQNEPVEGRISLEVDPYNIWVYLQLKDGIYCLRDKKLNLKNIHMVYEPLQLQMWSDILCRNNYYGIHLTTEGREFSSMKVTLSELDLPPEKSGLVTLWEREKEKGWNLCKIYGTFCGLEVGLENRAAAVLPSLALEGSVRLQPTKILPLLDESWKNAFSFSLFGRGVCLNGKFQSQPPRIV